MRKQIIAMLLVVAMCTELLAGCVTSMVAETSTKTKIAQADKALLSEESEEDSESVTSANVGQGEDNALTVIQTGSNGMVCGQVINRVDGTGVAHARLTVYDSNGEQVAVTPYKRDVSTVLQSEDPDYDMYDYLHKSGDAATVYVTDAFGYYYFQLPKPGTYSLKAEAEDYCEMKPQMIEYYDKFNFTLDEVKKAFQKGVEQGFENGARLETLRGYRKELKSLADKESLEEALQETRAGTEDLPEHMLELEPSFQKAEEVMEKLNLMTGIDEGETEGAATEENRKNRTWAAFWEKIEKRIEKETPIESTYIAGNAAGPYLAVNYNANYIDALTREYINNYVNFGEYWNEEGGKEASMKVAKEGAKFMGEEAVENTVITAAGSSIPIIGTGAAFVGAWVKTGAKLVVKISVKGYKLAKGAGLAEDVATQVAKRQRHLQEIAANANVTKEEKIAAFQKAKDEALQAAKKADAKAGAYLGHTALRYQASIDLLRRGIDVELDIRDVEKMQEAAEAAGGLFLPAGNTFAAKVKIPGIKVMEAAGMTHERSKNSYVAMVNQFQNAVAENNLDSLEELAKTCSFRVLNLKAADPGGEVTALYNSFYQTMKTVKNILRSAPDRTLNNSILIEVMTGIRKEEIPEEALFDVGEAKDAADTLFASVQAENSIQYMEEALTAMANGDMAKAEELFGASRSAANHGFKRLSEETEGSSALKEALSVLRKRADNFRKNINSPSMMGEMGAKLMAAQAEVNHARMLLYPEYADQVILPMDYTTFLNDMRKAMQIWNNQSRANVLTEAGKALSGLDGYPELAGKGEELLDAVETQHIGTLLWTSLDTLVDDIETARRNLGKAAYEPIPPAGKSFAAKELENVGLYNPMTHHIETVHSRWDNLYAMLSNVNTTARSISNPYVWVYEPNYRDFPGSNLKAVAQNAIAKLKLHLNDSIPQDLIPTTAEMTRLTPEEALQKATKLDEAATEFMAYYIGTVKNFTRMALEKARKEPAEALKEWGESMEGLTKQQIRERAAELAEGLRKEANEAMKAAYKKALDLRDAQQKCLTLVVKHSLDEAGEAAFKLLDEFEDLGKSIETKQMAAHLAKVVGTGGVVTYLAVFLNNRCEAMEADIPRVDMIENAAYDTLHIWHQMQAQEESLRYVINQTFLQPITRLSGRVLLSYTNTATPVGDVKIEAKLLGEQGELIAATETKPLPYGGFVMDFAKEEEVRSVRKIEVTVSKEGYEAKQIILEHNTQGEILLGDILLMRKSIIVSGRVIDEQGTPLQGISVHLYGNAPGSLLTMETDGEGRFDFERSIGYYELWVEDEQYEPQNPHAKCFDGRVMEKDTDLGDVIMKVRLWVTPTPQATITPEATPSPQVTPTPRVTVAPSLKPIPTPTSSPRPMMQPIISPIPSMTPTTTPTVFSTVTPTVIPTVTPTVSPSVSECKV